MEGKTRMTGYESAVGTEHCEALGTLSVTNMGVHQVPLKEPYIPRGQHEPRDVYSAHLVLLSGLTTGLILMATQAGNDPNRSAELAPTVAQQDPDIIRAQKAAFSGHRLGNSIHRKWNTKGSGTEGSSVAAGEGRGAGKQLPLG